MAGQLDLVTLAFYAQLKRIAGECRRAAIDTQPRRGNERGWWPGDFEIVQVIF